MKFRRIGYALIIAVQIMSCIFLGEKKRGIFCDETYSYGLANSKDYTFINYESARNYSETGWVDKDFFENYTKAGIRDIFNFRPAFKNQENDVHPPLYYMFLHIASCISGKTLSKWPGIGLNLVFLFFLDFFLFYIADYFFKDRKKAVLAVALWSFSAAGFSNILFIRMYLLQTLEIASYTALHIWICRKRPDCKKVFFLLALNIIAGGLTHYYFYVFAFLLSAPICLFLLRKGTARQVIVYASALATGFLANILIFPSAINHIFNSYRGTEVSRNLGKITKAVFKDFYIPWISKSICGGLLYIFVTAFFVTLFLVFARKFFSTNFKRTGDFVKFKIERKKIKLQDFGLFEMDIRTVQFALLVLVSIGFSFVAIQGSEIRHNRYIYSMYPFFALFMTAGFFWCYETLKFSPKLKYLAASISIVLVCFLSVKTYGIDFRYPDFNAHLEKLKKYEGYDCIFYYGERWRDIYTGYPLHFLYDETYFCCDYAHKDEIPSLKYALDRRRSKDKVLVNMPEYLSEQETEKILGEIEEVCGFSGHNFVDRYYARFYALE